MFLVDQTVNTEQILGILEHVSASIRRDGLYEGYLHIRYKTGERGREITAVKVATHLSSILPFTFVFALKHLASQKFHKDKETKNEVTTWLRAPVVEFYDIGIL